ncbi:MAG: 30S ribosomal protein S16, partial [Chlorobium sp.]
LRLRKLGRSEEDITAEMEKWQQNQADRRVKRIAVKTRRRQAKKAAEASGSEA